MKKYDEMKQALRFNLTSYVLKMLGYFLIVTVVSVIIFHNLDLLADSEDFPIFIIVTALFWWGYYFWFNNLKSSENMRVFQHVYALFGLILVFFLCLTMKVGFHTQWVFFLIYPILMFVWLSNRNYIYWSIIYFLVFILYVTFEIIEHSSYEIPYRIYFTTVFYCLLSISIGWIGSKGIQYMFKQFNLYALREQRKQMFHSLNVLVPIIEQRHARPREEVQQMSTYLKKLVTISNLNSYKKWELDLLSLAHYVSRIAIPDYLLEKKSPLFIHESEIIQNIGELGFNLLGESEEFQQIKKVIYYHRKYEERKNLYEKDDRWIILTEFLDIVDDYLELTQSRPYKENIISKEEALKELSIFIDKRYSLEVYTAFQQMILEENQPQV